MKKLPLLAACGLVLAALSLSAAEVTADMAARAVGNWRVRRGQLGLALGRRVADARRVERDGAKFNVVRMDGGGYVVTSADTSVRPVILFSDDSDFPADADHPALALLVGELAARPILQTSQTLNSSTSQPLNPSTSQNELAWAELLDDHPALALTSVSSPDDIRVEPIVKAKWNQSTVTVNGEKKRCFNYYTPKNYVCGCVATAAGMIMRRFEWPCDEVPAFTGNYCVVDGVDTNIVAQAGYYDWSKMPYVPNSDSTTLSQRQAIGKLVSDIGIAVGMDYDSDGASATTYTVQYALTKRFGYSYVAATTKDPEEEGWEDYGRIMRANFDAGLPVQLSVRKDSGGGHSIVGDGYGYIGEQVYYHLNFGWSGSSNAWYAPPDLGKYDYISGMVHNIYTNQSPSHVIASGRVTDSAGQPVSGVTVWAEKADGVRTGTTATSDRRGIYALYVEPGDYRVVAHRDVVNSIGEVIAEIDGETTASPVACYSITANESGGYNYKKPICCAGNASDCDIVTTRFDYDAKGTVAFSLSASVGTNFTAATAHLGGEIVRFGRDFDSATLSVALYADVGVGGGVGVGVGGGVVVDVRSVELTEEGPFSQDLAFEGVTPGTSYRFVASLRSGDTPFAEAVQLFTAACGETVFAPTSAVMESDELVMDVRLFALYDETMLVSPPDGVRAAVAGVRRSEMQGEFVVWDGGAWVATGVEMTIGETYRVLVTRSGDRLAYYLVQNAQQLPLGAAAAGSASAPLAEIGVLDAAEIVAFSGRNYDPNLVARADGTAEYADLASALAAGETDTLTPLWMSSVTIPADRKLIVFSMLDPSGLLSLSGGNLLKETVGADGSVTRAYGTMDPEQVAASDYLKATMLLDLNEPLTPESEVLLDDVAADGGALSFRVAVDGEPVTVFSDKVVSDRAIEGRADYIRIADNLAADAPWRRPSADELSFEGGKVTVFSDKVVSDKVFIRLEIPKD